MEISSGRPYTDVGVIRIFSGEVDVEELVWHRDKEDRKVEGTCARSVPVSGGGGASEEEEEELMEDLKRRSHIRCHGDTLKRRGR